MDLCDRNVVWQTPILTYVTATPLTFAGCFGWLHLPDGPPRATGIVLCAPFGCEWLWTHRTYRRLATALAEAGFAVLRFDYHGAGDSLGGDEDPERLAAWLASIGAAIDTLKTQTGVTDSALFGLRLGATLATVVAARRDDVRTLALWAPFPTGRAFVREARAFALLKNEPKGADLQVAGFVVTPATQEALNGLDATAEKPRCRLALVLPRDDVSGDTKIAAHLTAHGVEVTAPEVPGYAAMMRDPHQTEVPKAAIAFITQWFMETHPARLEHAATPPPANALLQGPRFTEHAQIFGERAKLFGIVTEPTVPRRDRPGIILFNVGSNHHIGPNRMTVTLARALAAHGFTALRFDIGGLGDSTPAPGEPENRLYADASVGDAKAAVDFFKTATHADRFVLVGLCSGAYLAYYATLSDKRVCEQILINLQTFHWREGDSLEYVMKKSYKSTRFYRHNAFSKNAWTRLLRGEINFRGIAATVVQRVAGRAADAAKSLVSGEGAEIARAFKSLSARGTSSFLIFSNEDGGIDEMERHLGPSGRKLRKHDSFRLGFIADADHTFTPLQSRRELITEVTAHLDKKYP